MSSTTVLTPTVPEFVQYGTETARTTYRGITISLIHRYLGTFFIQYLILFVLAWTLAIIAYLTFRAITLKQQFGWEKARLYFWLTETELEAAFEAQGKTLVLREWDGRWPWKRDCSKDTGEVEERLSRWDLRADRFAAWIGAGRQLDRDEDDGDVSWESGKEIEEDSSSGNTLVGTETPPRGRTLRRGYAPLEPSPLREFVRRARSESLDSDHSSVHESSTDTDTNTDDDDSNDSTDANVGEATRSLRDYDDPHPRARRGLRLRTPRNDDETNARERGLFVLSICSSIVDAKPLSPRQAVRRYVYTPAQRDILDGQTLEKRQFFNASGRIITTGPSGGVGADGILPVRKEVRELAREERAWSLYLLAMERMMVADQSDPLSWYQIAGIHGRPYKPWANVMPTPGAENSGYCTHISILFPTWHRPYLALFEQVLYDHVQNIAALYPAEEHVSWQEAARIWRMPYWDWAYMPPSDDPFDGPQTVYPQFFISHTATVTGPNGQQEIANPLYKYTFHPLDPTELSDSPFESWQETLRWPTDMRDPFATTQDDLVPLQVDFSYDMLKSRLYNLLAMSHNYSTFSNEAWILNANGAFNDWSQYDSLEGLHDVIHGAVGVGGHMSFIEYAAFDPLFMLHHAMVDRVLNMWEHLNGGEWITGVSQRSVGNSFTMGRGVVQDGGSPLTPFWKGDGGFWSSEEVRGTEGFGYVYPGLGAGVAREEVVRMVNMLYGPVVVPDPTSSASSTEVATSTSTTESSSVPSAEFTTSTSERTILSSTSSVDPTLSTTVPLTNTSSSAPQTTNTPSPSSASDATSSTEPTTTYTTTITTGPLSVFTTFSNTSTSYSTSTPLSVFTTFSNTSSTASQNEGTSSTTTLTIIDDSSLTTSFRPSGSSSSPSSSQSPLSSSSSTVSTSQSSSSSSGVTLSSSASTSTSFSLSISSQRIRTPGVAPGVLPSKPTTSSTSTFTPPNTLIATMTLVSNSSTKSSSTSSTPTKSRIPGVVNGRNSWSPWAKAYAEPDPRPEISLPRLMRRQARETKSTTSTADLIWNVDPPFDFAGTTTVKSTTWDLDEPFTTTTSTPNATTADVGPPFNSPSTSTMGATPDTTFVPGDTRTWDIDPPFTTPNPTIPSPSPSTSVPSQSSASTTPPLRPGTVRTEYTALISVSKLALNGPFWVYILVDGAQVGGHFVFAPKNGVAMSGPSTLPPPAGSGSAGGGALTPVGMGNMKISALLPLSALTSLPIGSDEIGKREAADAQMAGRVQWQVKLADGRVVESKTAVAAGLEVQLLRAEVKGRACETEFPEWRGWGIVGGVGGV